MRSQNTTRVFARASALQLVSLFLLGLAPMVLAGCAGFVSGTTTPPPTTVNITNVQAISTTTSSTQVVWTTDVASNSVVNYGTTISYGFNTPVDPTMVTSHQVTVSGLLAGTTYYFQVQSTDAKNNDGKSGGHKFATASVSIAGTITPTQGGSGATVTLSGATTATTTTNNSGAYTFTGLASGSYSVTPSNAGYSFTPASQNVSLATSNMSSVNFTATAGAVAPTITAQPANQTVTAGQTATFTVVASGTAPLSYQWQKNGANLTGATSASYTTPATTTSDNGSAFVVVVSNSAGTATSNAATLTVNPAPAPAIQVNPTSISFGNAVVGTNLSQSLIISNTGSAALSVTQINVTGATFSASGYALPLNVNAGQQTTITMTFSPTAVGAVSGNVSLVSNAPTSPTSLGLSGSGIAATLTLGTNPTSLSFGNVLTGTTSATQNVTMTNTGNSNVTISQITVTGAGYTVTGGTTPLTLTPSQNLVLGVQFSPASTGSVAGSISIVSNATGSPATVTLLGTGVVQHTVSLSWNASTSTVSGYNVYRSTTSGTGYVKINSSLVSGLTYTDSSVSSGTTYYYVTTAVDSSGNESAYSNQATAVNP